MPFFFFVFSNSRITIRVYLPYCYTSTDTSCSGHKIISDPVGSLMQNYFRVISVRCFCIIQPCPMLALLEIIGSDINCRTWESFSACDEFYGRLSHPVVRSSLLVQAMQMGYVGKTSVLSGPVVSQSLSKIFFLMNATLYRKCLQECVAA